VGPGVEKPWEKPWENHGQTKDLHLVGGLEYLDYFSTLSLG
jgi:hypothetical protein